ncbi:MAG: hypothetical protein JST42_24045 [Bacteroidetes bacterium]|nr:hypothetical protein [Bacteroidota bacterium]
MTRDPRDMSCNRHKRRTAFKSTVAVIGLVLFTVQLSYKFYVFSSQPLFGRHATANRHEIRFEGTTVVVSGHVILSLDKRYDIKHVFALLPQHIDNGAFPAALPAHYPGEPPTIKENALLPDSERGPPAEQFL